MEVPQKRKETNYDDNSYDFRSGCRNGCQGGKCKQQHGNGQVKDAAPNGKKIRAAKPMAKQKSTVLTN